MVVIEMPEKLATSSNVQLRDLRAARMRFPSIARSSAFNAGTWVRPADGLVPSASRGGAFEEDTEVKMT
jgi:hypothetical protein